MCRTFRVFFLSTSQESADPRLIRSPGVAALFVSRGAPAAVDDFNELLRDNAAENAGTFLIDLASEVDGTEDHPTEHRDARLFGDGVHFTEAGAEALAPWIFDQIELAVGSRSSS